MILKLPKNIMGKYQNNKRTANANALYIHKSIPNCEVFFGGKAILA